MPANIGAAIVAASLVCSASAGAACPPAQGRDCAINLDAVPQISRQIVAGQRVAPAPKKFPFANPDEPYTGPTLGVSDKLRRAPEIGYRWSIN